MMQPSTVEPLPREPAVSPPDRPAQKPPSRPRVPHRIHLLCYGFLSCVFAYTVIARYVLPLWSPPPIGVTTAEPGETTTPFAALDQRIDPNLAGWVELTRLPGIGEVMAKRIVAYRQEREHAAGEGVPVFRSLEDLGAVRGIGQKTLERLEPYLRFPDTHP